MGDRITIVKIGGKVIDDPALLHTFLSDFARLEGNKILVHGGGKIADKVLDRMGIVPKMTDGRRITDRETLDVVVQVYAGLTNKTIVAQLQANDCQAIGLSGADLNVIRAVKRSVKTIDYGFAGDVEEVSTGPMTTLLNAGATPVLCPVTHDKKGQLLNTNADTIAAQTAQAFARDYPVDLVYCFEIAGVMKDLDSGEVFPELTPETYREAKESGALSGGILPKLDNAFESIGQGVDNVVICHFGALKNWGTASFTGTILKK